MDLVFPTCGTLPDSQTLRSQVSASGLEPVLDMEQTKTGLLSPAAESTTAD